MNKPLLIEIIVEELPAIPFLKELPNITHKWNLILKEYKLLCDFELYYTPRRVVFWHEKFPLQQENSILEYFGSPVKIAYKDGLPTQAALAFAKKCGVCLDEITTITKEKGELLYFKKEIKGASSATLLNEMINKLIQSLHFGKSMRWGTIKDSFIRPIRNLSVVHGNDLIEAELFAIKSSKSTLVHRMASNELFIFDEVKEYFELLEKNGVILYQDSRKALILKQMKSLEVLHDVCIEIDEELLAEIVAITEYPTVLIGKFDAQYLTLPAPVIITSMKEHQRYFPVYKQNVLTNNFIVVSNAYTQDFSKILSGNEKVLKPRLSDALFFYNNDLKNGLSDEGLKKLLFVQGLGTMYDKSKRELEIAYFLAHSYNIKELEYIKQSVMLSYADLSSEMVFEFTNLQGVMGYYYAKALNKDVLVYTAIKEQYLPNKDNGALPSNRFSSIIALSKKLDTLLALFSLNKIPTGSKDPFALRRAASGIIKIVMAHKLEFNLSYLIEQFSTMYAPLDKKRVIEFFYERLFKIFEVNSSVINAVIKSSEQDLLKISQKIEALDKIVKNTNFKEYSDTFKRISNINKDIEENRTLEINPKLFEQAEEKTLYDKYLQTVNKTYKTYEEHLSYLLQLKPELDNFFDNVFVNHEDENIKTNRKNIIGLIHKEFNTFADIKEISI